MFPHKFVLSALTLETSAWAALGLDNRSDGALLLFLTIHAAASLLLAFALFLMLPSRLSKPRLPTIALLFIIGFAVPILGFLAMAGVVLLLRWQSPRQRTERLVSLALPEMSLSPHAGNAFRLVGMRSFLTNARAPVANRLRALVALQNVSGRLASPLLRNVLTDSSEDIRLLAYGMLDNKEKFINEAIHRQSKHLDACVTDGPERAEAARVLADLYWELVYQELAQGDLRTHALQRSLDYTLEALRLAPEEAALHLRHGRLLQSLGDPTAARQAYERALALGMPKTRVVPYLAEVTYDMRHYGETHRLMRELGQWRSLPRLRPVIDYWNRT